MTISRRKRRSGVVWARMSPRRHWYLNAWFPVGSDAKGRWESLARGRNSLGADFECSKPVPFYQFFFCFVFAVEDVISPLPALGACFRSPNTIMGSSAIISHTNASSRRCLGHIFCFVLFLSQPKEIY